MGEGAVEGAGGGVVGSGGVFFDVEEAEVLLAAVFLDIGDPLLPASVPGDAEVL